MGGIRNRYAATTARSIPELISAVLMTCVHHPFGRMPNPACSPFGKKNDKSAFNIFNVLFILLRQQATVFSSCIITVHHAVELRASPPAYLPYYTWLRLACAELVGAGTLALLETRRAVTYRISHPRAGAYVTSRPMPSGSSVERRFAPCRQPGHVHSPSDNGSSYAARWLSCAGVERSSPQRDGSLRSSTPSNPARRHPPRSFPIGGLRQHGSHRHRVPCAAQRRRHPAPVQLGEDGAKHCQLTLLSRTRPARSGVHGLAVAVTHVQCARRTPLFDEYDFRSQVSGSLTTSLRTRAYRDAQSTSLWARLPSGTNFA